MTTEECLKAGLKLISPTSLICGMATLAGGESVEEKMNRLKLLRMNYQLSYRFSRIHAVRNFQNLLLHPADNTLGLPQLILSLL